MCNKEKFPKEKKSIISPNYMLIKDWNTFREISLLSNLYKILPNQLLLRMTPYTNEII